MVLSNKRRTQNWNFVISIHFKITKSSRGNYQGKYGRRFIKIKLNIYRIIFKKHWMNLLLLCRQLVLNASWRNKKLTWGEKGMNINKFIPSTSRLAASSLSLRATWAKGLSSYTSLYLSHFSLYDFNTFSCCSLSKMQSRIKNNFSRHYSAIIFHKSKINHPFLTLQSHTK